MPVVVFEQELQLLEVAGRIARGDPTALPRCLDARGPVAVAVCVLTAAGLNSTAPWPVDHHHFRLQEVAA